MLVLCTKLCAGTAFKLWLMQPGWYNTDIELSIQGFRSRVF